MFILALVLVIGGWLYVTWSYYRHCMQQELLAVLSSGTRGGLPLHAAVKAFALERPEPWLHRVWSHVALAMVLPGLNLWYQWSNYRRSLLGAAEALEEGGRLSDVLRDRWGLVSRETTLAAMVGEASGQLSNALEQAHVLRGRFGTLWIKLAVHLVYPFLLAFLGTTLLWFQSQSLAPQINAIVAELEMAPEAARIAQSTEVAALAMGAMTGLLAAVLGVVVLARLSGAVRWYAPGIAWYHRARVRAQLLEMLALMLRVGQPLPKSFAVLAAAPVGLEVRERLLRAAQLASQGLSAGVCLRRTGLAPRRWTALLESAQRRGQLSWAMRELGDSVHRRLQRRFQRVITVLCPLLVAVIGGIFAVGCFGSFYPLIYIIDAAASAEWVR